MKRIVYSIVAMMLLAGTVTARNIDADEALEAAVYYMQNNTDFTRFTARDYTLARTWMNDELGVPSMYLFTTPAHGWIIMAACTTMDPMVAFSDDSDFDTENVPQQAEWWLEGYNSIVCEAQKRGRGVDNEKWLALENHSLKSSTKDTRVVLTRVRWGQGNDKGNTYNMYCPQINGVYCVTGCVATAMAQLCYYYKYPKQPTGFVGYTTANTYLSLRLHDSVPFDYSIMPERVYSAQTSPEAKREVARLSYYIGVASKMSYGTNAQGGSGAYTPNAVSAMATNFKYKNGEIVTRGYVSESTYMSRLRGELEKGYICYMNGTSPVGEGNDAGGHAWLVCGYRTDDEDQYYMNWGWDGTSNGFYNLGKNDMPIESQGYNFIEHQGYVVGLVPPADSIVGIREVETDNAALGSAYPNPATVSVELPYSTVSAAELTVYSVDGRKVSTKTVQPGSGSVRLDVASMPAGIYIYRMGNAYGKFVVK